MMSIRHIIYTIEKEFQDNWAGEVHFEGTTFEPTGDRWIHVDVHNLSSTNRSYEGCEDLTMGAYITCYAENRVQAAALYDSVTAFITNRHIDDIHTRNASPISQGKVSDDGTYYYKMMVYINN